MNDQSYPVTVLVKRPDGSSESVRVGTAVRTNEGFQLSLGELSIGALPDAVPARRVSAPPAGGDGLVFPPYGQSRGQPIAGATQRDLDFYRNGCLRTLNDPAKERFHGKERTLLAAIEAELARQGASPAGEGEEPRRSYGGGGGGGRSQPPAADAFGGAPDYTDDDIPF